MKVKVKDMIEWIKLCIGIVRIKIISKRKKKQKSESKTSDRIN